MVLLPPRAALQELALFLALQLGLECQQEGLATQAQEGCRDLAIIPQAVRALLSPWQSLGLK